MAQEDAVTPKTMGVGVRVTAGCGGIWSHCMYNQETESWKRRHQDLPIFSSEALSPKASTTLANVCIEVVVCGCACERRPEVNVEFLLRWPATSSSEMEALIEPGGYHLARLAVCEPL